jgi:hypothetical protein
MGTVSSEPKCNPKCQKGRCADYADVVLQSKDYCLDHFINHCYERLEMFEPLIRAVVVCFRHAELTHADRPRLLQILLWSEDLQRLLRRPGNQPTASTPQLNSVCC